MVIQKRGEALSRSLGLKEQNIALADLSLGSYSHELVSQLVSPDEKGKRHNPGERLRVARGGMQGSASVNYLDKLSR